MESSVRLFIEEPLSEAELLVLSGEADRCVVSGFTLEKRRREALMWRYIVRRELGEDTVIEYDENGAPQLLNRDEYIGISHSADFVAVIISQSRCAVDIERLDRNFERVTARYIRPEERILSNDKRLPAAIWCAKETLYKFAGKRGLDLLRDVKVHEVDLEEGFMVGQVEDNPSVRINLRFHLGNIVAYIA